MKIKYKSLYLLINKYEIIDEYDFYDICKNQNNFKSFEDAIHICVDTDNLELLSYVLKV